MNIDLLYDGLFVMVMGMGVVFFFLVIMIFAMNIMSYIVEIINKYYPEEIPETNSKTSKARKSSNDEEIALAIACAIHQNKG